MAIVWLSQVTRALCQMQHLAFASTSSGAWELAGGAALVSAIALAAAYGAARRIEAQDVRELLR